MHFAEKHASRSQLGRARHPTPRPFFEPSSPRLCRASGALTLARQVGGIESTHDPPCDDEQNGEQRSSDVCGERAPSTHSMIASQETGKTEGE